MNRGTTLLLGITMGAVGLALYLRLRQVANEENPDRLLEEINRNIAELERRLASPTKA